MHSLQFMLMGLRGLTVLFSAGDDGIGNFVIRTDYDLACSQGESDHTIHSPYCASPYYDLACSQGESVSQSERQTDRQSVRQTIRQTVSLLS